MKTFLLLLISLTCLSGVQSQRLVQSSDPVVIKPGTSHKLSCQGFDFTFSSHYMDWLRETSDGTLTWLGQINPAGDSTAYHDSVKGRFTISRDNSNNMLYLQMSNMKSEDTARYYCARADIAGTARWAFDVWSAGQPVTVTSAVTKRPSVFPLVPCCNSLSTDKVSIGCLSTGYHPTPVDVQWNSGSITSGIRNFPAVLGKSGTYLSASLLTVPSSDLTSDKKYVCNVNHKASGSSINKEIEACESKTSPPTVKVMQASCGESGSVDLVCLISKFSPKDIKIQWLLNGEQTSIIPSNSTPFKDDDGTFGTFSKVSVPKDDWFAGDRYTCKVHHAASESREEDTIKKCQAPENVVPKVAIFPPTPKDLIITKQPKVTCVVAQVESPESLTIKWQREDGKKALAFTSEPEVDYTGRYTVKSTLKLSLADWTDGKTFTCIVNHKDLPTSIEKSIKKTHVETTEPSVYLFPPAADELAIYDFATLICFIKSFKPKDVYIQWLKNGIALNEEYYTNTDPILQEEEDTYYMYSTLTIEKSDWNRGVTWTCNCVHSKITSKDIKKSRGK